jgi:hypothetical protein
LRPDYLNQAQIDPRSGNHAELRDPSKVIKDLRGLGYFWPVFVAGAKVPIDELPNDGQAGPGAGSPMFGFGVTAVSTHRHCGRFLGTDRKCHGLFLYYFDARTAECVTGLYWQQRRVQAIMQFGGGKPPVGVVFDADLGNTIDDALALALLYGLQGKGESRVVGVIVSRPNLKSAEFADLLVRFYTGEPGPFSVVQPIGLTLASRPVPDTPLADVPLARQTPEGKPLYPRSIAKLDDTADPVALIRNNLSAQFEDNAIMVCTGPATDLAGFLDLPEAKDLITDKVRYLVLGAGAYPDGPPEPGIRADIRAARRVLAEWPGPIVACGAEVGAALPFPDSSLDKDFAWTPAHPVVDAYRAAKPAPYDAPSGAMAAALYAVRPNETYFQVSGAGTITVLDDGRTHFAAGQGRHRYLIVDPAQKDRVIHAYTELASTHPIPRQRFRPGQKKKQQN